MQANLEEMIIRRFEKSAQVKKAFADRNAPAVARAALMIVECYKAGGKVLICGNGGSAADAQHIAAELVNRMMFNRDPLAAVALTTDTSVLTSIANDFDFQQVFAKQVEALGRQDDVIIGISTSGRSENVIRALVQAGKKGLQRIALTGPPGSPMEQAAELCLCVDADHVPCIQETHLTIGHMICEIVEAQLFPNPERP